MSKDRVAFIPWPSTANLDFRDWHENNNLNSGNTHHHRQWQIVYADSPGTPLAAVGMGMMRRIHVVGHGAVDSLNIWSTKACTVDPRSVTDVVDALVAKGLKKVYMSTIVCDVCHGAIGYHEHACFAQRLARELWSRGYRLCTVMGYQGELMPEYEAMPGHTYPHRRVQTYTQNTPVKSKDAQKRFFGWL